MQSQKNDPQLFCGDVLAVLPTLPERHFHTVVTSPPYWGLRDYGVAGQLGSEKTPEEYIGNMVLVFREVRRVLRDDGCLWLNMGDSFSAGGWECKRISRVGLGSMPAGDRKSGKQPDVGTGNQLLMPHRLALALQQDGWVVRQTVVWAKRSPMPESINGVRWARCRVKIGSHGQSKQTTSGPFPEDAAHRGNRGGSGATEVAQWVPCPGCPKCTPNGGYVLKRGSWRPTTSHEYVFMLTKAKMTTKGYGRFGFIKDQDARWIALFVETEGNICIKRTQPTDRTSSQYGAQIAVANSFLPLLEELRRIVGTGTIHKRSGKNAPVYYWQVANKMAAELLVRIYPFMIGKRRQARLAIYLESLIGNNRPRRTTEKNALLEQIWLSNKSCNQFGDPDLSWCPEPPQIRWKSLGYFADAEAGKEPDKGTDHPRNVLHKPERSGGIMSPHTGIRTLGGRDGKGANLRSVWTLSTEPYKAAHFAVFPPSLVHKCLVSTVSKAGCCPECGACWAPVVESEQLKRERPNDYTKRSGEAGTGNSCANSVAGVASRVLGYRPTCKCPHTATVPCRVLDPFSGSGTVGQVCQYLGCDYTGVELNQDYVELSKQRIATPWVPKEQRKKPLSRPKKQPSHANLMSRFVTNFG